MCANCAMVLLLSSAAEYEHASARKRQTSNIRTTHRRPATEALHRFELQESARRLRERINITWGTVLCGSVRMHEQPRFIPLLGEVHTTSYADGIRAMLRLHDVRQRCEQNTGFKGACTFAISKFRHDFRQFEHLLRLQCVNFRQYDIYIQTISIYRAIITVVITLPECEAISKPSVRQH